ncbi:MAG: MFS transporter [Actinomycetota bacterium]|nr:MFS transporter [Actinomycetota bacterium]
MQQHKDFLRLWAGQAMSSVGDGVHRIAVLWWARQATGSDAVVVLVALATVLPTLAAAPVAGWLVDRYSRRGLMLAADVVRCGTSVALAMAVWAGSLSVGMVVAVSIVAAAAAAVFDPALMSSVTLLVAPERRVQANSMLGVSGALAGIVGPALGGVLIGVAGTGAALWFDAGTFLLSFLMVVVSRIPMPVVDADAADHTGMGGGWRLVRANREVRDLVVVGAGLNLCVAPVGVLIVGLAAGPLGLGGSGFGLLEAAVPAGLVCGFIAAPKLVGRSATALTALLVTAAGIAVAGVLPIAWWAGLSFLAAGLGAGVVNAILPTRFQESVDPAVQGRVFALVGALSQAGRPVGLLLTAPLVALVGLRAGFAVCGLGIAIVAIAGRRGLARAAEPLVSDAAEFDECLS